MRAPPAKRDVRVHPVNCIVPARARVEGAWIFQSVAAPAIVVNMASKRKSAQPPSNLITTFFPKRPRLEQGKTNSLQ